MAGIALLNHAASELPAGMPELDAGRRLQLAILSPVQHTLSFSPTYRVDYQFSSNLRISGKWSGTTARVQPNIGSIPGFNDTIQKFPLSFNTSGTVNYTINPTTFVEATYGMNQNRLGTPNINDPSNRFNVNCPADLAAAIPSCTLGSIAFPFTGDIPVDTRYYEYKALKEIGVPFLEGETFKMAPSLNWAAGGTTSRLCGNVNGCNTPPNQTFPGFMNINRTQDFSISITKVRNTHTYKAGFYINHSYKAQNFGAGGNGAPSFQGALNFGNDTNNPLDTGFPWANAAIGVFSSYGQQSAFIEGSFLYNNVEWFVQDNWKVNRKLTLDYGVRFVHQQPQYDQFNQVSTFRPETWKLASAPFLYMPGCVGNTATCSGTNRGEGSGTITRARLVARRKCDSGLARWRQRPDAGRPWHREYRVCVAVARRHAPLRRRIRLHRQAEDRVPRIGRLVLRSAGRQLRVQHCGQPPRRNQHAGAVGVPPNAPELAVQGRAGADGQLVRVQIQLAERRAVERRRADRAAMVVGHRPRVRRTPRL